MDLLAPILTYLGTVTAIIAAVTMAYGVFIYKPLYSMRPPQTIAMAMPPRAKPPAKTATESAQTRSAASRPRLAVVRPADRAAVMRRIVRQTAKIVREPRRRWPLRETRARPWAYPPPPRYERYAFRYAQAPFESADDEFR